MPPEGIRLKARSEIISYEEIIEICRKAAEMGIEKIRLTGGEPLLRKDICSLIRGIANIAGIKDLSLTTNGVFLKDLAGELKASGLKRVNVSLDSLDPKKYAMITGGELWPVLEGVEKALAVGLSPVKINVVLQKGVNDDELNDFMHFSYRLGVKLQIIQPMSLRQGKPAPNGLCTRPPDCSVCNRIRLTADGKFKPCLFSDIEIDARDLGAEAAIRAAVDSKPEVGQVCYQREMVQIGG